MVVVRTQYRAVSTPSRTPIWDLHLLRPCLRQLHQHWSQIPSSTYSSYCPSIIPPPASLASSLTTSRQSSSRRSPKHSLPVRTPRHRGSPFRVTFGHTFNVKKRVGQEEVNTHNDSAKLMILDEYMSTDVDIVLLPSLESEVAFPLSSSDWVSEHSVAATPTEMSVHAPLPVWSSDQLTESSEVGRLPLVMKRRVKLSVQAAGDMCEAVTQENCLIYAACRAWPRRLAKRKSNVKWPAISVTSSHETTARIMSTGGNDVVEKVAVSSRRVSYLL
ncbi:hypothetical protein AAHC03_021095 [Spirometra sp. Aus1]